MCIVIFMRAPNKLILNFRNLFYSDLRENPSVTSVFDSLRYLHVSTLNELHNRRPMRHQMRWNHILKIVIYLFGFAGFLNVWHIPGTLTTLISRVQFNSISSNELEAGVTKHMHMLAKFSNFSLAKFICK